MKNIKVICIIVLLFSSVLRIFAQEPNDSPVTKFNVKPFFTLYHQHHDFFNKAFSFQGLESGFLVRQNIYLGIYGAFFASNLKAVIDNGTKYIWIGQGGVEAAYVFLKKSRIHPGFQLNGGIFTLRYDEEDFGLFDIKQASFKLSGIVLSPQIFGELDVTDMFKIRTGLSYNFYSFDDQSKILTSNLNHISFTFGLLFQSK